MWRSLQKQDRGQSKGKSTAIQGVKISYDGIQHAKIFAPCETPSWHTSAISHTSRPFSYRANQGAKISYTLRPFRTVRIKVQKFSHRAKLPPGTRVPFRTPQATFRTVRIKGGLSASPSSPMPRREQSAIGGASSPPAQDSTVPPSEGGTPSQRRYPTRRPPTDPVPLAAKGKRPAPRPPAKRTKFSGPDEPSQSPHAEPPTEDSQIPVGIPLETVIRRPMIAGPPIEGNLDCRDRSFHSETWFDVEALRQQPELRDSFRLLQRYHIGIFSPLGNSIIPE
ncbi:hypothetical protein CK203_100670 [Vitis vinifera]|uniref:Uncharacterized protein n=1 Tax=Vitis vinifera TaxID=29760 RepID=A0A438D6B7_VITVI|nr:hypothetical protein CK203_100670 [Vitis vinifera]